MATVRSAPTPSRPTWRKTKRMPSTRLPIARKGKLSHTAYKVLKETKDFSLLEVDLMTGRKHQIRVHLAGIGHPVVGDQRYGKENKRYQRLALHARSISFKHPFSGEPMIFETKVPVFFNTLVGQWPLPSARSI